MIVITVMLVMIVMTVMLVMIIKLTIVSYFVILFQPGHSSPSSAQRTPEIIPSSGSKTPSQAHTSSDWLLDVMKPSHWLSRHHEASD